jgi:arylsulfatase A-like enzyme
LRLLAGLPLLPGALAAACSKKGEERVAAAPGEPGTAGPAGGGPAAPEAAAAAAVAANAPWAGRFPDFDLVERLGFAALFRSGLWIDFGTTDGFKYTLGGWVTGWGDTGSDGDVRFGHAVGSRSSLVFPVDAPAPTRLRMRAKGLRASAAELYVNGKRIGGLSIGGGNWNVVEASVAADKLRVGDNLMQLVWREGPGPAAAVDWIHLGPADAPAADPLSQASLRTQVRVGPRDVQALLIPPATGLGYAMDVPTGGILGLALGARDGDAKLVVRARTDGAEPRTLLERDVSGEGPEMVAVDLASLAGRVVRLELENPAASGGSVTLAHPAVWVEPIAADAAAVARIGGVRAKNVVLVMIDTLRADHVPPYGRTRVQAPVLQLAAERGALFERFSAVEDWTKPSCATMLTGLYPNTHKTQTDAVALPNSVRMISEELREHGVKTAAFIANGYVSDKFGFKRGWDHYVNYIREGKRTEAENVLGEAAAWIEANRGDRFYAYVHTIDPHVPYWPPAEYLQLYWQGPYDGPIDGRQTHLQVEKIKKGQMQVDERDKEYIRALHDGEISYHDAHLGSFFRRLDELGLMEDTLVIVVSDHGEEFWDRGSIGHGHSIFQELVHVPFLMMWKGVIPPGRRIPDNHDHAAIVPTVFDAMGVPTPDYCEARSLLPRAIGRQEAGPHAGFSTHQGERMAVWSGSRKLQMNGLGRTALFDLAEDPGSERDIDDDHPLAVRYMRTLLGQFMGAPDKRDWQGAALGRRNVAEAQAEAVEMDDATRRQLCALGYLDPDECAALDGR